jgi:hypothetical protein
MIGVAYRWLRRTMPPAWTVALAIFPCLVVEGFYLWLKWYFDGLGFREEGLQRMLHMRDTLAGLAMAAYGIFRVMAFHPLFRNKYREWLEQTPWAAPKPLPLGPIHLIWQDAVILGIVLLALHDSPQGRLLVLGSFLLAYLLTLGFSFWLTGPWWMGYLVLAGLALSILLANDPLGSFGVLVAVYLMTVVGTNIALRRFPWPESKPLEDFKRAFTGNKAVWAKPIVSWPFTMLLDVPPPHKVLPRDGFLAPLLAAWWVFAIAWNVPDAEARNMLLIAPFLYGTAFGVMMRLIRYIGGFRPPISLFGRFATGRIIIPGYDHVLLAPLCMLLTAACGLVIGIKLGPDYHIYVFPLAMALVFSIGLNGGPSLRAWQLTGRHRTIAWDNGKKDPNRVKL